ncbi:rRNA methyltransferase [Helicobacter saguini]|uniref:Ribosomal RNA large subunit methyltransferase H n=1 Tax=Helicobacter saguini TaxID=1548018 RepID=A0A347VST9_9HELI|nr:23S rRNA (pseudouridine(1915)-N(3))-methyltransferase RlmH [Helicobacter saguini]MWV62367.1 rRNA methyltransferase [Helicobacter saguini]MWV66961.1 rRNA methyltransferase [Helicobacter saguini]MWV69309.1 rRNA methyltransferase [Helicobacter saguini]MWV71135.1 rRNA methyltransferase [Helicobacter saguini]TLD94973.1 23S rRNA (pseudouridine(1915)-N(3))-methyltransferase RlmH [Helicobacter saguini]
MKIHIFTISKGADSMFLESSKHYLDSIKGFNVSVEVQDIWTKNVAKAQKADSNVARVSYTQAFSKHLDSKSILLDAGGKKYDSINFAKNLEHCLQNGGAKFFIAGAFGFESNLLKAHNCVSLSDLTLSHSLAKIVLLEQIYRAISIINKHPYHK